MQHFCLFCHDESRWGWVKDKEDKISDLMAAITQTWYIFYFHFLVCCMLKRPGTDSNHPNPLKHTWKPAGFWVARPTSVLPSSGSTSSLFITVTQSDEQCSTLNAQTHILSKTQEESEPSVPSISATDELAFELQCDDGGDSFNSPPVENADSPKRKRHTKNTVIV